LGNEEDTECCLAGASAIRAILIDQGYSDNDKERHAHQFSA
jgi:hypothetical protein